MGTTVVCALVTDGHLIVAHVGDSRLYLLRRHASWFSSRRTIRGRRPSSAPAARGNGSRATRHVLTNVLGARPDTQVHLLEREIAGDETLLLCSDGLHGSVSHETLREIVVSDQELPAVAQSLISTGARSTAAATTSPRSWRAAPGQ